MSIHYLDFHWYRAEEFVQKSTFRAALCKVYPIHGGNKCLEEEGLFSFFKCDITIWNWRQSKEGKNSMNVKKLFTKISFISWRTCCPICLSSPIHKISSSLHYIFPSSYKDWFTSDAFINYNYLQYDWNNLSFHIGLVPKLSSEAH